MRNLFVSLSFLLFVSTLQSQEVVEYETSQYSSFYKDSTYFILADNVNVRLNPDIQGKVIYQLNIAEKVRIIEDTKIPYTMNGYTANWYRVVYKHNGDKGQGYVWGGMIATQTIESTTEKGLYFMYGVSSSEKQEDGEKVTVVSKICKDNKELSKTEFVAQGSLRTFSGNETLGNKGISGVKEVFKINFSDGYCGGVFGDAYLFWTGTDLLYAITLPQYFDAPYYSENIFIFPNEENGNKKGLLLNKIENGYYGDNGKKKIEDKHTNLYQWTGSKLVMIKGGK